MTASTDVIIKYRKPKQYTNGLVAIIDSTFQNVKEMMVGKSWPSLLSFAKIKILSLLQNFRIGYLRILTQGQIYEFGNPDADPQDCIELVVNDDKFWVRLLLLSDLGFAESYMSGEVHCDNLTKFFRIFIENRPYLHDVKTFLTPVFETLTYLTSSPWITNTLSNALQNIQAHYDISNEMFAAFLDPTMMYSCAYWEPNNPTMTLEEAQIRKLREVIALAHIEPGNHVLEIGSGWGSFAIEAVKATGCRVTTLTLSEEQKILAEKRILEAGLRVPEDIEVLLQDYRLLPSEHQFDRIVSIEMIEAVGKEYLETYFRCCDGLLTDRLDGVAVYQCITIPESRYDAYSREVDFIRKYIFPGGHCPSLTQILTSLRLGSRGHLLPHSTQNIGPHYVKTLRLWRERFMAAFENEICPAMRHTYPDMTRVELETFRRKWEYYFSYCEGGFKSDVLGVHWVVAKREGGGSSWAKEDGIPM